jgi:hypothetical protein
MRLQTPTPTKPRTEFGCRKFAMSRSIGSHSAIRGSKSRRITSMAMAIQESPCGSSLFALRVQKDPLLQDGWIYGWRPKWRAMYLLTHHHPMDGGWKSRGKRWGSGGVLELWWIGVFCKVKECMSSNSGGCEHDPQRCWNWGFNVAGKEISTGLVFVLK